MRLEDLIKAYKYNNIKAEVKEKINDDNEHAGVIKFSNDINASYLLDEEEIVVAMQVFCNCVIIYNKNITSQIQHSIETIKVLQKTIELIVNTTQEEANNILTRLDLFNDKLKENKDGKALSYNNYIIKVILGNGILMFSIFEVNKEEIDTP